tara:strand:+ start:1182 stop:2534 length:1353 start_codon:yes stop_codon:yes gene_type:complete
MTSTIKVDNIQKVSDASNIIKKCSATTTVGSGAGNTVVVCGSTVTIGRCGGTVALASGATQTGFGASGAVTWETTIKTGDFTASSGEGYFVNTTSGAVTVTLPGSPSAGNIVAIADYAGTAATNNITIGRNSSNFQGAAQDGKITINRQVFTLVYIDGTQGWLPVSENDSSAAGPKFIAATGGTITCGACGNTKIHTFTGPGTFCISSAGNALGSNILNYTVVAGGGGGSGPSGRYENGGGGAGGYREANDSNAKAPFASSTLASNVGLTAATGPLSITVGAGGGPNSAGSNSIFSSITSAGGGAGGSAGGSGGGGPSAASGANGNTPAVSPPQGNPGGAGHPGSGRAGGGGGAGETGFPGPVSGQGGDGVSNSINDTLTARSGGGGGSGGSPNPDAGPGGDGGGAPGRPTSPGAGGSATANTGGAGGGGYNGAGGSGGSGIVIIRYRYQ